MSPPAETGSGRTGGWRLADRSSSYLRSAAEQPIEWYPWGPEPFELAKRTGRPILLDIGASWCHWCHVMDEGTYSDPEVARLLLQHFVAVKVDRDEHPEIDRRYQRQVGALTGEGGWPLTGFLTSEGEVFLGGTYFPPADGHGRPGFRRVLKEVSRLYREEPERIRENAQAIQGALKRMRESRSPADRPLDTFVENVRGEVHSSFDPVNGGFGMAPKFPHPTAVTFLLWDGFSNGTVSSSERAHETLLRMADGGLFDQVGGGFHRYSVDEGWHIPHFEKMGVDNAALLSAYTEGAARFQDPRLEEVVRSTIGWAREVLADPRGGFGASQDADNAPGDDGGYFTWSRTELKEALDPDELRLVVRFFGVGTDGRMPHDPDRNVLFRLVPLAEAAEGIYSPAAAGSALARAVAKLRAVRANRPTPTVDRAVYADINGRFIAAFARSGAFLGDSSVVADARNAADRLLQEAFRPGQGMAHRIDSDGAHGFGLLEDQVAFASGLLELSGVVAEPRYLETAVRLLELVDREFRGEDGLLRDLAPGLYDAPVVGGVTEPSYPLEDSPHVSANASAVLAFLRTASLTHDDRWSDKARALLQSIARRVGGAGLFAAGSALAAGLLATSPATVVIEGTGERAETLLRAARRAWHPNVWVFRGHPPPPFSLPGEIEGQGEAKEARALVCFGNACAPPVTDPAELAPVLASGGRPRTGS
ncbi:MAG TPA: thioredoxin domain-containing protein [Thermoplasmata archaeon]|nr:thioredoxin domain-containing protein [Thermoplasmata archaeon]